MLNKRRVLLLVLTAVILVFSWLPYTSSSAESNVKEGLTRSLTAFGVARALGAAVSLVQSVQVSGSVVFASGSVGIGEVLQPLNELIDQFAKVMLAASVSFGIQLVLLKIGAHWIVSALVSVAVLYAALRDWNGAAPANRALQGALMVLLMVRFAVPAAALGSEAVYKTFMAGGDTTDLTAMQRASPSFLGDLAVEPTNAEPSASKRDTLARMLIAKDAIRNAASGWTKNIVHLIASFLLQTVLLPLAFLFVVWRSSRLALNWLVPLSPKVCDRRNQADE